MLPSTRACCAFVIMSQLDRMLVMQAAMQSALQAAERGRGYERMSRSCNPCCSLCYAICFASHITRQCLLRTYLPVLLLSNLTTNINRD